MQGTILNRESFLENIAKKLGREGIVSRVERPKWKYSPQDEVLKNTTQDDLIEVLRKQCQKIHTQFVLTAKEKLKQSLKDVVNQYGGGPIVSWKDAQFEEFELLSLLQEEWPKEEIDVHLWDFKKGDENIKKAEQANIGITISHITLAESATAVLFSSKDRGRTVSFLPSSSIIIIPKSTIVPRITQAARMIKEKLSNGEHISSCINFITGPSNSADIEMNLVVGVHGPVKATYIVVEDL